MRRNCCDAHFYLHRKWVYFASQIAMSYQLFPSLVICMGTDRKMLNELTNFLKLLVALRVNTVASNLYPSFRIRVGNFPFHFFHDRDTYCKQIFIVLFRIASAIPVFNLLLRCRMMGLIKLNLNYFY